MTSGLAQRIRTTFDRALSQGHVIFTDSTVLTIPDGDINVSTKKFQVRLAPSLAKKPEGAFSKAETDAALTTKPIEKKPNPFLPHDPHMFVDELEQHNILLNKFSIVREHILVTTKEFESQYNPLNASDWSAAWKCLTAPGVRPYVGFYNCGGKSGASVPHKHMQLLPRSLEDQDPFPPVGAALKYFVGKTDVGTPFSAQHLPFVHGFAFLPPSPPSDPGFILAQIFRKVLTHAFKSAQLDPSLCLNPPESVQTSTTLSSSTVAVESTEPPSYNVIFTKEWMMVVPRRKESVDRISINSVGFAGCLLAKSEENVELLRRKGCLNILVELGYPTKFGTPYAVV